MRKYSYHMLFGDFKEAYPNKWRRGTSYKPDGFMSIKVYIPQDGIYKYEFFGNRLTLLEEYVDPVKVRVRKRFERDVQMEHISETMKNRGISQKDLSSMSGVSRQSINKYLSHDRTPKQSTVDILMDALGILGDDSWRDRLGD